MNLFPVSQASGLSDGYLRPHDGIVAQATAGGTSRGGILWNGLLYRVMGTKLVSITSGGAITTVGDVGGTTDQAALDYSYDRLAVVSGGKLWYYDGSALTQVTDPDVGTPLDLVWVDGYFLFTDGTYLIVTDLASPTSVNPLKYGSADLDPDSIVAVKKLRNEIYAIGRYTIEVFQNVGGSLFPFQRITGAQIMKGAVGTKACCVFNESIAFLGSARNEPLGIYLGTQGAPMKISTREIDTLLRTYTEAQMAAVLVEPRVEKSSSHLWVHLPDRTLVYDFELSQMSGKPVWFVLTSGMVGFSSFRAQHLVWAYNRWNVADTTSYGIGYLSDTLSTHWGSPSRWEFSTPITYNNSQAVIFHSIELFTLSGRVNANGDPTIATSFSTDGMTWSSERSVNAGRSGDRTKNIVWFRQGWMRNWRIQRFRGNSDTFLAVARLEAQLEGLSI